MNRSHRHLIAVCAAGATTAPIAALALRVTRDDGKTRLIPAGSFHAPRGAMSGSGPWHLDEAGARHLIERAATRSTDIVIDYEHQTLLAERNGLPAPAAGWVAPRSLEWRADGLYGHVQWTNAAKAAIDADSYRYLSPVFPYDADTGAVLDLLHVALTNTPAIDTSITELAAARAGRGTAEPSTQEATKVDRKELIAALGLKPDATDEQIKTALAAAKSGADDATALRTALGARADAKPEDAVAALKRTGSAQPDMSQYVPKAVFDEQQQTIAALRQNGNSAELEKLIDDGLKSGQIPGKATADWLKGQGLAACRAYLDGAPPVAALAGGQQTGGQPPRGDSNEQQLSEADLAVCRSMGITPEEYRKSNPKEEA